MEDTSKLLMAFVTLIIGIVLIGTVATGTLAVTEKQSVSLESYDLEQTDGTIDDTHEYTVTNAPTSWKTTDCPLTNFKVTNSSGDELTLTTDYTVTLSTGVFLLVNNDDVNMTDNTYGLFPTNKTYVSYTYCGDDYMNLSWGRTMLNVIAGLFAIAILIVSIALFYDVARKNGLIR